MHIPTPYHSSGSAQRLYTINGQSSSALAPEVIHEPVTSPNDGSSISTRAQHHHYGSYAVVGLDGKRAEGTTGGDAGVSTPPIDLVKDEPISPPLDSPPLQVTVLPDSPQHTPVPLDTALALASASEVGLAEQSGTPTTEDVNLPVREIPIPTATVNRAPRFRSGKLRFQLPHRRYPDSPFAR